MRNTAAHTKYFRTWQLASAAHRRGWGRLSSRLEALIRLRWAADLPGGVAMSEKVILMHNALGVVIHQRTVFEGRAVVFQHVTFGDSTRPGEENLAPRIADRVVVGAGAIVLGGVHIGFGSVVAAGTVVTRDVPPHSLARGIPMSVGPLADHGVVDQWFDA